MGWRQVAVQLEAHELVTATMKRTGSDDFGPGNWSEPLEVLCTALRREADLDLAGRRWARAYLLDLLTTRAEHAAAAQTSPSGTSSVVENDAIPSKSTTEAMRATSAASSGTTPETLLAATPDQRDPWHSGAPPDDDDEMALTLCSIRFEQWWHVPGYAEWLDSADLADAYGQWAKGPRAGRGGLLHLEHLPDLRAALPTARVEVRVGDLDAAADAMVAEVVARRAEARAASRTEADVDRVRRYWHWRMSRMLERAADATRDRTAEATSNSVAEDAGDSPEGPASA